MLYLLWNNCLANFFFNPANAGKNVFLYITKGDIINIGKEMLPGLTDQDLWDNYILAIKGGLSPNIKKGILEKALECFEKWKHNPKVIEGVEIKHPLYTAYLLFFILPITEGVNWDLHVRNYYDRLLLFLNMNLIEDEINSLKKIDPLWNDLESWTIIDKNGDYGFFELPKFTQNWAYVGKPFSQCLLPPTVINKLPEFFYHAGLIPASSYSPSEFKKLLLRHGPKILLLKDNILDLIKKSNSNELGESIIETIIREYNKWTGETHEDETESTQTKKTYTVVPLFLQFRVNENDQQIFFSFRTYSVNDYPEDLTFSDYENIYETNGWSRTLNVDFKEPLDLKDDFNKWIARFPERDVRLFVNAGNYQLSTNYWIETETLLPKAPMYLLCKSTHKKSILEWGQSFTTGNFKEEELEGLPDNYAIFKLNNPIKSHPSIPLLTLFTEKRIEIVNGLRVNFRTFINDYIPEVEIKYGEGSERVFLEYRDTEQKVFLENKSSNSNHWLIPGHVILNADFVLKIEGERFAANELAYNLTSSNDSSSIIDSLQLPKRDSFGKRLTDEASQYCFGSNIVNPMKSSQRYYCALASLFTPNVGNTSEETTVPIFFNHNGNKFAAFLALKATLTTEDFFKAFEFFFSKTFNVSEESANINLTKIKKSSLNFYDYTGYLDYDYETKKIIVAPPQFVFIPCNKGRKVLLIGARDSSMIKSIIKTASKYHLEVEIKKQFSSNDFLLLPDVITIKAFGEPGLGAGERELSAFAKELNIRFSNDYFPQIALLEFSANIQEYENSIQFTDENDYGWARKIFNPQNLRYERNENVTINRALSLVEYKLNEYTFYNKLWKSNNCYKVDKNWGRYILLKHYKKNVILFDSKRKRVAIPIETPLPRLLSKSIMLLSGFAPDFNVIDGKYYRVFENIPGLFTENLFHKLSQQPINKELK